MYLLEQFELVDVCWEGIAMIEAYSEPIQISKMEPFVKIVNGFQQNFPKKLDFIFWLRSECTFEESICTKIINLTIWQALASLDGLPSLKFFQYDLNSSVKLATKFEKGVNKAIIIPHKTLYQAFNFWMVPQIPLIADTSLSL